MKRMILQGPTRCWTGLMGKKVTAKIRSGQKLGFEVEGIGDFDWQCGSCEFPYFVLSDERTTAKCGNCGAVNARLRTSIEPDLFKPAWKV